MGSKPKLQEQHADVMRHLKDRPLDVSLAKADSIAHDFPEYTDSGMRLKWYAALAHDRARANELLKQFQSESPSWTFNSRMIEMGTYPGLDSALVMENFNREMHGNKDTVALASLLVGKGSFLARHGWYADALPVLKEAERARLSLGAPDRLNFGICQGWIAVAELGMAIEYSEQAAINWLNYQINEGKLSYFAMTAIKDFLVDRMTDTQKSMVVDHYVGLLDQLRKKG